MTGVNALPVEVPLPRHEPSALSPKLSRQHRITEIHKNFVGVIQANCIQRRCAFKDPHILLDLCGGLYHCPKLPVHFRPYDICRSETDDTVSVNRAEQLLLPFDVDQTVFQQACVQILAQKLLFYLSQKSFLLRCEFFVHIIPPILAPFLSAKRALVIGS